MATASANEVLDLLVLQEAQVVTYRKLSRELRVHINVAKRFMLEYYEAKRNMCHATFLLTGRTKQVGGSSGTEGSDGNYLPTTAEMLVKLVSEIDLSDARQEVDDAAYHIYSIQRKSDVDRNALVASNISTGSNRDMADLSAVTGSTTQIQGERVKAPASVQANRENIKAEKKPDVEMAPAEAAGADSEAKKAKDEASDAAGQSTKAKASFFGRQLGKGSSLSPLASSKLNKTARAPQKPASAETEAAPPRRGKAVGPKPKDASPSSPLPSPPAKSPPPPAVKHEPSTAMDTISSDASDAPKKPRVEDMFDDDDFEDTPTNRAKSEDKAQGDDFAAESMDVDAESDDKPSEPTSASESKTTPEQLQPDGRNRVRKRRKVSRIKHTKNSRGILMTQTVDEWESYSESESEPQARPKKTHVRGKAAEDKQPPSSETKQSSVKGKKPAQHRSLLSFFGKK